MARRGEAGTAAERPARGLVERLMAAALADSARDHAARGGNLEIDSHLALLVAVERCDRIIIGGDPTHWISNRNRTLRIGRFQALGRGCAPGRMRGLPCLDARQIGERIVGRIAYRCDRDAQHQDPSDPPARHRPRSSAFRGVSPPPTSCHLLHRARSRREPTRIRHEMIRLAERRANPPAGPLQPCRPPRGADPLRQRGGASKSEA